MFTTECGSTKHLCVHHIDYNRNNNNLLNLQTVCKRCHQELHVVRDEQGRYTRRIKTT